ncbi:MAG: UbiD family decarboxylase [Deltaproteobacteria bacterium]|nr:UbiD family decarboxylase [Deltaproteobacteria bacterium]
MRDLRAFLDVLRRENELVEIDTDCDPHLEIAEIHRRVIAGGGPALLFKRPRGADFPLVTNLFGTKKRVDLAFGQRANAFIKRAAGLPHELVPPSIGKLWGLRDFAWEAMSVGMKTVGHGPVTEVSAAPNLTRLPLLHCWQRDGGSFVTLPLVYTEHPETGVHNLGMYRIQRYSDSETGIHWQVGKGGGFHYSVAEKKGQVLPLNLFVGGPPALIAGAIAPLPENVPELLLTSLLVGEPVRRVATDAGPLPVVADAEFAFVGEVAPGVRRPEGPFGDHYGYYSLQHDYPVFTARRVFHRKDAIFPATVVGKPRQEDFFLGDWLQELLSPLFPVVMPAVRDLWSYGETGYHSLSAAVVWERYGREAMASAFRVLGEGQLSLTKFLLVLDRPVDLRDFKLVLETVLARFRPEKDLYVFSNLSMDTLDYCGPAVNEGSKGIMLGVGEPVRDLPRQFQGDLPFGCRDAVVYCGGCLVLSAPAYANDPGAATRIAAHPSLRDWPMVVLADDAHRTCATDARLLWTTFTRMEPAADIHGARRIHRNHVVFEGPLVFDARMKPTYPEELFCDPDTAALVSRRWAEYFPGGGVEMGDSDTGHLDKT